jgi:hypothetical protein
MGLIRPLFIDGKLIGPPDNHILRKTRFDKGLREATRSDDRGAEVTILRHFQSETSLLRSRIARN